MLLEDYLVRARTNYHPVENTDPDPGGTNQGDTTGTQPPSSVPPKNKNRNNCDKPKCGDCKKTEQNRKN